MIKIKKFTTSPQSEEDGFRILIDRLWPRGISKEKAKINTWVKGIDSSSELRAWFAYGLEKS